MAAPNPQIGIWTVFVLTAGLIAYAAYESWEAAQPPTPAVAASDEDNEVTPNNAPTPRTAILDRTEEDQRSLRLQDLTSQYKRVCTCDTCTPSMYFNHPISCHFKHAKNDIVIEAGHRPKLIVGVEQGAYEGLSLARCTIAYFSRAEMTMDSKQRAALTRCQITLRDDTLNLRAADPGTGPAANGELAALAADLNEVFFFGAIKNMSIEWNRAKLESGQWNHAYGLCQPGSVNGKMGCSIYIHPLRKPDVSWHEQKLAEHRLGSILHEMLHGFLMQYECGSCHVRSQYLGHHGRAWQCVAKAIEERCLDLLRMEAVFGRHTSMMFDRITQRNQSIHDLQDWGFVEHWAWAENRREWEGATRSLWDLFESL